ncbi:major facilitator superfamily domain-containing protein [Mycena vulgaris]|nr:major facilitator superfamily domain-containing protein [Mycena vulgaris]
MPENSESNITEKSELSPGGNGEQIDGGVRGWSTVAGAWLIQFCVFGVANSFGTTETYYVNHTLSHNTPSQINWIGSIQLFLELCLGVFSGKLFDAGYFRWLVTAGTLLYLFSLFMLSLAKEGQYYQIFLSQGLGIGIASGMFYMPLSGAIAQHFTKRRGFAMGIILTGSSLGGFVFPLILGHFFRGQLSFGWGIRTVAFICTFLMLIANPLLRAKPVQPQTAHPGQRHERTSTTDLLKSPVYLLIIASGFVIGLAIYFPMFSVQLFALDHPRISENLTLYLLSMINISAIFGRTVPNWLADRFGVFQIYVPCTVITGVIGLLMFICTTPASIVAFCILYGFFSGSVISLYFPAVLGLDPDMTSSGLRLGIACIPVGIAALIGTPLAAALVGSHHRWWAGSVFTGVANFLGAALILLGHILHRRTVARRTV